MFDPGVNLPCFFLFSSQMYFILFSSYLLKLRITLTLVQAPYPIIDLFFLTKKFKLFFNLFNLIKKFLFLFLFYFFSSFFNWLINFSLEALLLVFLEIITSILPPLISFNSTSIILKLFFFKILSNTESE